MEFLPMNFSFPASPIPDLSLCTLYHDSLISAFLFVAYYIGKSSDDHFANLQTVLENADNFLMAQYFVSAVHDQRGVGKPFEHFLRDAEL